MSGFLYQMLGCAAVRAATCQTRSPTASGYDVLISLARGKDIYQEVHGQDMALKPLLKATGQGTVLVQFKYSLKGVGKPVLPAELKTIASRLAAAAKDVEAKGDRVSCCCLVTNRQLNPVARKLWKTAARATGLSKTVRDILKKLHPIEKIDYSDWFQTLEAFAASYGSFASEIEDGIRKIVGRLFQQGASHLPKPPLRLADLVEAFTGAADAKPLVRSRLDKQTKCEVGRLSPGKCGILVRREILDRVVQEAHHRALIVFAGHGGMGKTASLHAWANELAEATFGPFQPLVVATTTRDLTEDWPDRLLSEWRNLHASGREKLGFSRVVQRLKAANPNLDHPILHVCLDGLDEHADDPSLKRTVGMVVRWFMDRDRDCRESRSRPTARLVVTCRDGSRFSKDWLPNSSGFPSDEENLPPVFDFDQFTEGEFARVVRDNLPLPLRGRLLARGAIASTRPMMTLFLEDNPVGKLSPKLKPASDELVAVLHDPAMWRSFLDLDPPNREAVINNDQKARLQLGTHFVNRFCEKSESRTGLRKEDVLPTLRNIAVVHQNRAREFLTADDWTQAARARAILDLSQIGKLLAEARSGGLVNDNTNREWQWRNSIIEDCLLSLHDLP